MDNIVKMFTELVTCLLQGGLRLDVHLLSILNILLDLIWTYGTYKNINQLLYWSLDSENRNEFYELEILKNILIEKE